MIWRGLSLVLLGGLLLLMYFDGQDLAHWIAPALRLIWPLYLVGGVIVLVNYLVSLRR